VKDANSPEISAEFPHWLNLPLPMSVGASDVKLSKKLGDRIYQDKIFYLFRSQQAVARSDSTLRSDIKKKVKTGAST